MSHKSAKKIRKLLNKAINKPEGSIANPVTERAYTENTKNRKKQLVELKTGERQEIEVSYGTMRVNADTGRGIYKMVKRAMAGKSQPANMVAPPAKPVEAGAPEFALGALPPEPELIGKTAGELRLAGPDCSETQVYTEAGELIS